MEISRLSCRVCLTESEFNVSLFGSYCRRTSMVEKILVCLKLVIEEADTLDTICYKCAENVERYYDFFMFVKKSQTKLVMAPRPNAESHSRRVTSYVREQVQFDSADYTFSFLEMPEEKKEAKSSSPLFSYFSPHVMMKQPEGDHVWKTPSSREKQKLTNDQNSIKRQCKPTKSWQSSMDLFESQSQDVEKSEKRSLDWNLTPENIILKRVKDKCFGRLDY